MRYVYIMTNKVNTVLYIGSTSDIVARTLGHKKEVYPDAFTRRYRCFKLVWYEEYHDHTEAVDQEYRMKRWRRDWKEALINSVNPEWKDLSEGWYTEADMR